MRFSLSKQLYVSSTLYFLVTMCPHVLRTPNFAFSNPDIFFLYSTLSFVALLFALLSHITGDWDYQIAGYAALGLPPPSPYPAFTQRPSFRGKTNRESLLMFADCYFLSSKTGMIQLCS